jgi:hypothetical protein
MFAAAAAGVMVTPHYADAEIVAARNQVFRERRIGVIDSSGPPKGLLGNTAPDPVRDFSTMTRQRRRYEARQEKKRA